MLLPVNVATKHDATMVKCALLALFNGTMYHGSYVQEKVDALFAHPSLAMTDLDDEKKAQFGKFMKMQRGVTYEQNGQ